jgi:hypothetical protein
VIRSLRFFIVLLSILVIAQRAPAPIVEEEKPTPRPAAEQETTKHSAKPKKPRTETSEESKPAPPAKPQERFAGTWSGKINQTVWGDTPFTLTLSAGGAQVTEHSGFGTYSHSATSNGQMVTWTGGLLNEVTWTFTPSSNGSTARVTATSALGVNSDSIFRRGRTPALAKSGNEIPTAKPDPNRPGFVYNPFDPTATRLLDVRGKPSGAKVKDPSTGKMFIVP